MSFPSLPVAGELALPELVLGIDLGTTNTLVAVWREDHAEILGPLGEELIPSVVSFPANRPPVVGRAALERARLDPARTVHSAKRLLGKGLSDLEAESASLPYRLVAASGEREVALIDLGDGQLISPIEVSGQILGAARSQAARALDEPVEGLRKAVITVPAYFDDAQRQATREAAQLAGLEVLRLVNEPTAAALAYGLDRGESRTIAVYDLGGGTFDVSLLRLEDGIFQVLSTAGDTYLGGDDFDRSLMERAAAGIRERSGRDVLADPAARVALRMAAERCKKRLSSAPSAELLFHDPEAGIAWREEIQRSTFEELIAPLVERSLQRCAQALRDAGLDRDQVEEVVLVGGSTRIPRVRAAVEEFFARPPHTGLDPDQVVALGAAVQGAVLGGNHEGTLLLDVTPLSLGIETMGGGVSKLILRNSPLPARATEGFTTFLDGQTKVKFHVLQGERELAKDCRSLGEFVLTGIPPMPAGLPKIAVEFTLDADGILRVRAREDRSGVTAEVQIHPKHGLDDAEVENMLRAAWDHAEEDLKARRLADLRVQLETVVRSVRKNLGLAAEALVPGARARLRESLEDAEEALALPPEGQDPDRVKGLLDALEVASYPLAEALMNQVATAAVRDRKIEDFLKDEQS